VCPVYPQWCSEAGDHYDHSGYGHEVPSKDADEEPLIVAGLIHISGSQLYVNIAGEDLTAAEARVKAKELREMAAAVDAMAHIAEAAEARARAELA
jgi:hypothetical protein